MSNLTNPNPTANVISIAELRQQLIDIRRQAISLVVLTEAALDIPPEERAVQTRRERRQSRKATD